MKIKSGKSLLVTCLTTIILFGACSTMNKTQKGAIIGTAGGAAAGAVVGRVSGNTALGAIIGAAVGGVTGTIIGHKMDKQAEEIRNKVPNAKVERIGEGIVVEFNEKILFGFDQSNLTNLSKSNLDKLIVVLKEYPETNIQIQGHTDDVGTEKYNMKLSKKRSSSVKNYIQTQNINSSRLSIKGFGETAPHYSNATSDGQSQNRRVDFLITANSKMKEEAKKEANH
ncbi:MAG: OmpA family protein [Saprospiraceae bacterium]